MPIYPNIPIHPILHDSSFNIEIFLAKNCAEKQCTTTTTSTESTQDWQWAEHFIILNGQKSVLAVQVRQCDRGIHRQDLYDNCNLQTADDQRVCIKCTQGPLNLIYSRSQSHCHSLWKGGRGRGMVYQEQVYLIVTEKFVIIYNDLE